MQIKIVTLKRLHVTTCCVIPILVTSTINILFYVHNDDLQQVMANVKFKSLWIALRTKVIKKVKGARKNHGENQWFVITANSLESLRMQFWRQEGGEQRK